MKNIIHFLTTQKHHIIKVCIYAFFVLTMIFNLTHSALWGDEWVEYDISQLTITNGDMYESIITTFQPPLYNFVMHFWLKLNQSIFWFRFFNVVLGCISGFFLFKTLKLLYNDKIAVISLSVLAACYQWIYCIQECSEYALMLCALFITIYFYIAACRNFTYRNMFFFILASVMAMYSQYGSFFVISPLLIFLYLTNILSKNVTVQRKIRITVSYLFSLFVFAAPLYFCFARLQISRNQISGNTLKLTFDLLKDIPFTFGQIIGYFFNLNSGDIWPLIFKMLSIALIIISIFVLRKSDMDWSKKSIICVLWISYILHYILVQKHVYAMTHADQSAGFYVRYSYFYIPLLFTALPIITIEFIQLIGKNTFKDLYKELVILLTICILSFNSLMENWHKSFDDQFADIWMEHQGWNDTTYLYGVASYGFNYYISHANGYKEGYLDNATTAVDNNNLPLRFWAWRTNWSGDDWQTTIEQAQSLGYQVTIYEDSGYAGQLAYCCYNSEINILSEEDINLSIKGAYYNEDKNLCVKVTFRDSEDESIKYNQDNYCLSYHILNPDGSEIQWENDKTTINKWIDFHTQKMIIDTSQIEASEYIIQIDVTQDGSEWLSEKGIDCPQIIIRNGQIL